MPVAAVSVEFICLYISAFLALVMFSTAVKVAVISLMHSKKPWSESKSHSATGTLNHHCSYNSALRDFFLAPASE